MKERGCAVKKRTKIVLMCSALTAVLVVVALLFCFWNGIILLNNPSIEKYPVRGVDVSAYQGEIDWSVLSKQGNISFAFIKATEGSSFVDSRFEQNLKEAQKTELRVGVYHFFSFDSLGEKQAEHFINTVGNPINMLPPVIDVEFYGDKESNPPSRESVQKELGVMLERLEAHYGKKPIIYTTKEAYNLYIKGSYEQYDIWYRNVINDSGIPDGRAWTFWQYTNREKLDGYKGEEKYIDMNVFNGTKEEFEQYGK